MRSGAILEALYDRVADGGVDHRRLRDPPSAAGPSVERFRADRHIETPLQPVDASAIAWRKAPGEAAASDGPTALDEERGTAAASDGGHPRWRRPSRRIRSTCPWWWSSTTCGAKPPAPSTR